MKIHIEKNFYVPDYEGDKSKYYLIIDFFL